MDISPATGTETYSPTTTTCRCRPATRPSSSVCSWRSAVACCAPGWTGLKTRTENKRKSDGRTRVALYFLSVAEKNIVNIVRRELIFIVRERGGGLYDYDVRVPKINNYVLRLFRRQVLTTACRENIARVTCTLFYIYDSYTKTCRKCENRIRLRLNIRVFVSFCRLFVRHIFTRRRRMRAEQRERTR